jgi:hypothetical protein
MNHCFQKHSLNIVIVVFKHKKDLWMGFNFFDNNIFLEIFKLKFDIIIYIRKFKILKYIL